MTYREAPTVQDLLTTAAEALERDVVPGTTGWANFQTRVAVKVIRIAVRELEQGDALDMWAGAELDELGFATTADLVVAIQSGLIDPDRTEVRTSLQHLAEARLRISNPGYLERAEDEYEGGVPWT